MSKLIDAEAEELADLVCGNPPISRESATRIIAAALGIAESRGCIDGMQHVSDAIDRAFRPAKVA